MVPSKRKYSRKSEKLPLEDKPEEAHDTEKENKNLSDSEEDVSEEKTPGIDKRGKKRPSGGIVVDMGGEVQNMLEKFRADVNKALLAKRKRIEMYTKTSFNASSHKLEQAWKTQQEQRQKYSSEYSQQFLKAMKNWDLEIQKVDEQEEKLRSFIRQQQRIIQQYRNIQNQRLKTIKQLHDQFIKGLENMEKNENLLACTQNELKKEMALLQKRIMMETQQQEVANVRKSLQSMLL